LSYFASALRRRQNVSKARLPEKRWNSSWLRLFLRQSRRARMSAIELTEGVRAGDTIEGKQRWGGSNLKFGEGAGPNFDPRFSFRKT
jgi:hypothetical protein